MEQLEQLKEWDHAASSDYVQYTETDMSDLIKQCAAMFSWRKEQEKIPISVEADDYLVSVYVEGIQQVISNLLENAMQYDAGSEAIKVRGEQRDSFYYVAVSGQSEFIPEKEAGNLFNDFIVWINPETG